MIARLYRVALCLSAGLVLVGISQAATKPDPLEAGFRDPPNSARPRVWWHWMSGNITREGIQADLEWMHRTGIGGFQNFDADLSTPKVVANRLAFMTPEWKDAFHFAIETADRLGLEAAIAGSPGWSESGGPWVGPDAAMKKVVWSQTLLTGGQAYSGTLPEPPSNAGPYLDAPFLDRSGPPGGSGPSFYRDTRVIAFRLPPAEVRALTARATITSSDGPIDGDLLGDGSLARSVAIRRAPVGREAWIQFEFKMPQTVHAVTYASADHVPFEEMTGGTGPEIQASEDGTNWRAVATIPSGGAERHTIAFAPVTARYFRALWTTPPPAPPMPGIDWMEVLGSLGLTSPPPAEHHIAELRLEAGARVSRGEEKAGFGLTADLSALPTPAASPDAIVPTGDVIDVTDKMKPDGRLEWTPPAGQWKVLRMGYSLTGITNHPASPEGTGLEVDKLSAQHVTDYMSHYLDLYADATRGLMGKRGLQYVINDSWEAGTANWTEDLLAQFKSRRGYDATPWLPVLTGQVVGSPAASDRFLWDYRQTLADLLAENHYDRITSLLHARGMGHYGESHESGRAFLGDGMDAKRSNDVPMSAMWVVRPGENPDNPGYNADIRESASVAHIYGQNLVAAESLTAAAAAWRWSPATLKPTADKELAMGLNRFVIHTSVHQPLMDKEPGLALGPFGQWFSRNETWSGDGAKAWVDYLARSSWMLQQGRFVADVAWYYGEDSNITALYAGKAPPIPEGYPFDYVNAEVIRHQLKVAGGRLVTASGMSYRILAMDSRAAQMSLPVLRAVRDLVGAGAVITGPRPSGSPSLADDDAEYDRIVRQVWGEGGAHGFGRGRVYSGMNLGEVLAAEAIAPDFSYTRPESDTQVLAVHRLLRDGEIYFIDNRNDRAENLEVSLQSAARVPELWRAETGRAEAVTWRRVAGRTVVPLQLGPWEAVFLVLRKRTAGSGSTVAPQSMTRVATLGGSWHVDFQTSRHAPASAEMSLGSWTQNPDERIRYFAGTGTYSRTIDVPSRWLRPDARMWLDLGDVRELASVTINGRSIGVAWHPPFKLDITGALHPGPNKVAIAVTDAWVNRLIHDARPDATDKFSFTVPMRYKGDEPLSEAGLLGPVTLQLQSRSTGLRHRSAAEDKPAL